MTEYEIRYMILEYNDYLGVIFQLFLASSFATIVGLAYLHEKKHDFFIAPIIILYFIYAVNNILSYLYALNLLQVHIAKLAKLGIGTDEYTTTIGMTAGLLLSIIYILGVVGIMYYGWHLKKGPGVGT